MLIYLQKIIVIIFKRYCLIKYEDIINLNEFYHIKNYVVYEK